LGELIVTDKQKELMGAMENYVECMRESGKMYEMWNNFSPEVKKAVTILTTDIKVRAIEQGDRK
tara:strand:- start:209 stop:400 length:192 start_codon:yes stop_codon:yes gene_type:complete